MQQTQQETQTETKVQRKPLDLNEPNTVAVIASTDEIRGAGTIWPTEADILELRLDVLAENGDLDLAEEVLPHVMLPVIITVRDRSQGGKCDLSTNARAALYRRFLPHADLMDIETAFMPIFADLISEARGMGVTVIGSHHDFNGVPAGTKIIDQYCKAGEFGASIFKLAVTARTEDLPMLTNMFVELPKFSKHRCLKLSFMSMGELGKVSRVLFAGLGSVLNYGYIQKPQTPGQWPALELKMIIGKLHAT